MRAFVTGASGHVGGNLVRQLLDEGYELKCLVRNDVRALDGLDVEQVSGNLCDPSTLIPHMQDVDVVFHAAAYVAVEKSDFKLMEKINVGGTKAMTDAALQAGISRFIHFSSVHAFQQRPTNEPLTEKRPLVVSKKAAPYDRTKAAAQRVVLSACEEGLSASMVHPTGIIGPNDFKPSRMGDVMCKIAKRKMPITLNTGFNWVDVRDVCSSAIACVDKGRSGQHYLLPGKWTSFPEISKIVANCVGYKTSYLNAPFLSAYLALPFASLKSIFSNNRPSFSRGSLHALAVQCREIPGELASSELGHSARPFNETIQDTIEWMTQQGRL